MKRKHFLVLAYVIRKLFTSDHEVRFTSIQRQAILEHLAEFGRMAAAVNGEFSLEKFSFVVEHGREMSREEKQQADKQERGQSK